MLQKTDLTPEQNAAVDRLFETNQTLLIAGLGFGKAIVGLTALTELLDAGVIKRALVIAPLQVATVTWASEVGKWAFINSQDVAIACGTPKDRQAAIDSPARIIVTNFENAATLIRASGSLFDALLIDEVTKLKASGGALFKVLRPWVKKLKWRAGMSATPVAESSEDIYAQALLLDDGKALGTRKSAFLDTYFRATDYMKYNWVLRHGAAQLIADRLKDLVFKADDAAYLAGLPPLDTELLPVYLSPEAEDIYSEMEKRSTWNNVTAPNAAVLVGKLAQIAAGGLYAGSTDDPDRLVWTTDCKIAALQAYVANLNEPVIITYTYDFERVQLEKAYPTAPVLGGKGKTTPADIASFNRGEIPVMIGHPRSMSMGLNLQGNCRILIHLSPLWSADLFAQSIGRIHRRGQTKPCKRVLFYSPGTVDDRIAMAIKNKKFDEAAFMALLG